MFLDNSIYKIPSIFMKIWIWQERNGNIQKCSENLQSFVINHIMIWITPFVLQKFPYKFNQMFIVTFTTLKYESEGLMFNAYTHLILHSFQNSFKTCFSWRKRKYSCSNSHFRHRNKESCSPYSLNIYYVRKKKETPFIPLKWSFVIQCVSGSKNIHKNISQ